MDNEENTTQRSGRTVCQRPELAVTPTVPPVTFDTRLELASAGIDAVHAHNHGVSLSEAHEALAQASQEASAILVERVDNLRPSHPVLKAAGDYIRINGWTQNQFQAEDGTAVCALGAIRAVVHGAGWVDQPITLGNYRREREAKNELGQRIHEATGKGSSIPFWNDSRESVDDVLRLLY